MPETILDYLGWLFWTNYLLGIEFLTLTKLPEIWFLWKKFEGTCDVKKTGNEKFNVEVYFAAWDTHMVIQSSWSLGWTFGLLKLEMDHDEIYEDCRKTSKKE